MKVKLRIPAVAHDGLHEVGEVVDFRDPNQALALIRAQQADAVDDLPFPETPQERAAREDRERADNDRRRAEGAPIPVRPVTGHTPVPSLPAAMAATPPTEVKPEDKPGAAKPPPAPAPASPAKP